VRESGERRRQGEEFLGFCFFFSLSPIILSFCSFSLRYFQVFEYKADLPFSKKNRADVLVRI
jgi:hypothetical protein